PAGGSVTAGYQSRFAARLTAGAAFRSSADKRQAGPGSRCAPLCSAKFGQGERTVAARRDREVLPPRRGDEPLQPVVVRVTPNKCCRSGGAWRVRRGNRRSAASSSAA